MKYFLPAAKDDGEAEETFQAIRKFAKMTLGWETSDRKIFRLKYKHDGKDYYAEVGKTDQDTGEIIIAILESNAYLICTPNRGVLRGMPLLVGKESAYSIEDFDESKR